MAPQSATLPRESGLSSVDLIGSVRPPGRVGFGLTTFVVILLAALAGGLVANLLSVRAGALPFMITVGGAAAGALALWLVRTWPGARSLVRPRVAILGDGTVANDVAARLARSQRGALLGIFGPHPLSERGHDEAELLRVVAGGEVDKVAVVLPAGQADVADRIVSRLSALAVDVAVYDSAQTGALTPGAVPSPRQVVRRPLDGWQLMVKDIEDRIIGGAALILFMPLLAIVAIAVKLGSPGPVFFKQRRHGFRGREILVYKFRTMRVDAADYAGRQQTERDDPRITRVGRFLRKASLDELPQLLNVFRGEMSLVGPRPHPIDMRTNGKLCQEIVQDYESRHRVRPGITGWAQVNGYRGATTTPEQVEGRVRLDNYYIENWSLLFDLRIMVLTSVRLLADKNAF